MSDGLRLVADRIYHLIDRDIFPKAQGRASARRPLTSGAVNAITDA